jgi:hypothetical protein
MVDHSIHISEAEAARGFRKTACARARGAEAVIERDKLPVAVIRPAEPNVRMLSESLRLAREHACTAILDADFDAPQNGDRQPS